MSEQRFRVRRGRIVEIPPEWVGRTVHRQTIRKRRNMRPAGPPKRYDCKRFSAFRDAKDQREFKTGGSDGD